jgi:hypothetical protein
MPVFQGFWRHARHAAPLLIIRIAGVTELSFLRAICVCEDGDSQIWPADSVRSQEYAIARAVFLVPAVI